MDYYYSCFGSEIKIGSGNQPLAISSIFGSILCGCNETQRNVHTNLNSAHVLCLNTENVINCSCFDKEPSELYFSKVFYTENLTKLMKWKMTYILVFLKNLPLETIDIKLNYHLKNTMKLFRTILTCPKFDYVKGTNFRGQKFSRN